MKVLLTGGRSLLGATVARQMAARGDEVAVLQRQPAGLGLPEYLGDVADPEIVAQAVAGAASRGWGSPGYRGHPNRGRKAAHHPRRQ